MNNPPLTKIADNSNNEINNLVNNQFIKDEEVEIKELLNAILRRKKLGAVVAGSIFLLIGLLYFQRKINSPVYQGGFDLLINDPISIPSGNSGSGSSNNSVFETLARNNTENDIPTLISLLKSPLILTEVSNQVGYPLGRLSRVITINQANFGRVKAKGILNIGINIENKNKGLEILNSLSKAYLKVSINQRQKRINSGLDFLNKQAPSIQSRNEALELKLSEFRKNYNLLEPNLEGNKLKINQDKLEQKILKLSSNSIRLKDVREKISNNTISVSGFKEAISVGDALSEGLKVTSFDHGLIEEILTVEKKLAKARSKYTSDSIIVKGLKRRINELKPFLVKNQLSAVDTALNLNRIQITTLKQQLKELTDKFSKQPEIIKEYNKIKADLKFSQDNLNSLNAAREKFQLENAQRSIPWSVISNPQMGSIPVLPSFRRWFLSAVAFSAFFGVIAALLRDRFDHVFYSPNEIKEEFKLPLLGSIPHVSVFKGIREDKLLVLEQIDKSINNINLSNEERKKIDYQRFFYQEAFRNLYTSIRFLSSDKEIKSIVITSSIPSEGKSLINILLAKTIADIGKKVLLVDADLRKPQIHRRLGLNNIIGLSNLIRDSEMPIFDCITKVPNNTNLSVITSGLKTPDPTRLLGSDRLRKIMNDLYASEKFDFIIYDTPPVLGLADTPLVAQNLDGVILLVGMQTVDRDLPKEALNRIDSSGLNILGLVTNSLKENTNRISSYGNYGAYEYNTYINYASSATENENNTLENDNLSKNNFISMVSKRIKFISKNIYQMSISFLNWLDK